MRIHKEGFLIIPVALVILATLLFIIYLYAPLWLFLFFLIAALIFWSLIIYFFRNPKRIVPKLDEQLVYAPADGKVVVIEETEETEYYQDRRIQVSIFMSPLNVHLNRSPIAGHIDYYKYHPGKYLVAWHPKSSTENERSTIVVRKGTLGILVRQIAGAVARRIKTYPKIGTQLEQGEEFGFIKFGSRVDTFLPLDSEIKVSIGQKVKGGLDVLAELKA